MTAMTDLFDLGVSEAADAIRSGATSSEELVTAFLAQIAATDGELAAWATVDADGARAEARALLSPVAPGPAPRRGEGTGDPTLCAPWSYAGVPAVTLPTGLDDEGLPFAMQLVGGTDGLERLLGSAAWCERVVAFDARPP
jgi:Asp-tRNA(Asn)/Glu-tRNA(Gln) amidotransferase A subunit family amidase